MPTRKSAPRFGRAVITGAGSGIGRALCRELAAEGSRVFASDVDRESLGETAALCEELAGSVEPAPVDVSDRAQVEQWAGAILNGRSGPDGENGAPDLVVNNAGIALSGRVWEMTAEDIDQVLQVNYWGVVHGTQAFLPAMRRRDTGTIVNISSIFGIIGFPAMAAYNSSKFAVRGFTECLRMELDFERSGVRAVCVHPGGVRTNIVAVQRNASLREEIPDHDEVRAQFDRRARTTPESAARKILRGAAKGRRRILVGTDAVLIDLAQRLLGSLYQPLLLRLARRDADLL